MGLGLMTKFATICKTENILDSEGFPTTEEVVVANIRTAFEAQHASEMWKDFASFSEATSMFKFRYLKDIALTTSHYIIYNGERYNILSVENVGEKNMYYQVLAKKVESSNG